MRRLTLLGGMLLLAGCGNASPDGTDGPVAPPVTGPSAYVMLTPDTPDRGWDALEALDTELSTSERARLQVRGLASGRTGEMMVRFGGTCEGDAPLVAAIARAAARHGVTRVRCVATLPDG